MRSGEINQLAALGGDEYLAELMASVPTALNAEGYARLVQDRSVRRTMLAAAGDVARLAFDTSMDIDRVREASLTLWTGAIDTGGGADPRTLTNVMGEFYKRVSDIHDGTISTLGTPTGFVDLDKVTRGLHGGDLTLVAARPGMGKSVLVGDLVSHVGLKLKKRVALFSLEMGRLDMAARLAARYGDIDYGRLRDGEIKTDDEWAQLVRTVQAMSVDHVWIDDTPTLSVLDVRSKARKLHAQHGLDLVIVDYLQFLTSAQRMERRDMEVEEMGKGLKTLARELNCHVLAPTQVSRRVEERADKRPVLSDMREGGNQEGNADVVLGLYREAYYTKDENKLREMGVNANTAEVLVLKNRHGPALNVHLGFDGGRQRFYNLERVKA